MARINNNFSYTSPSFKGLTIGPKAASALDKVGNLKSPGQRLIFGVAALALQPALDKLNPWVDKDTRDTSAKRSVAKAIVSTATGVVIREACILGTNALLGSKKFVSKLPEYMTREKDQTAAVLGTLAGLGIMIFTNFLLDAPWTNKMTNYLLEKGKKNEKEPEKTEQAQPTLAAQPAFSQDLKNQMHTISEKINSGELPPMSQVNMEVIKWAS